MKGYLHRSLHQTPLNVKIATAIDLKDTKIPIRRIDEDDKMFKCD